MRAGSNSAPAMEDRALALRADTPRQDYPLASLPALLAGMSMGVDAPHKAILHCAYCVLMRLAFFTCILRGKSPHEVARLRLTDPICPGDSMKKVLVTLMLLSIASFASAQSASPNTDNRPRAMRGASGELGRMCTDEARGDRMRMGTREHRQFMRDCMRGDAWGGNEGPTARDADGRPIPGTAVTRQQTLACRDEADQKRLVGPERRTFMTNCVRDAARK